MKHLVATTALALILSAPAMAQTAQEQEAEQDQAAQEQQLEQEQQLNQEQVAQDGFLQRLQEGDMLVGELIGQEVYAPTADAQMAADQTDPEATATIEDDELQDEQLAEGEQARQMDGIDQARLQEMDNIGQVNEVIVGQDGEAKGFVIGVGGFLGIGEHEVALAFDRVDLVYDQDNPEQYYLVADTSAEQLENAPEFDRTSPREEELARAEQERAEEEQVARADEQQMAEERPDAGWRDDRDAFAAPDMEREGYQRADVAELSADSLIGSDLYDVNDDNIGSIDDVVLDENGQASHVVVDIGGFLGIGTHTVALGFDEITVMHDDGWDDFRVYVDATQEQLEQLPEYAER